MRKDSKVLRRSQTSFPPEGKLDYDQVIAALPAQISEAEIGTPEGTDPRQFSPADVQAMIDATVTP